jgi:hypothetical protein
MDSIYYMPYRDMQKQQQRGPINKCPPINKKKQNATNKQNARNVINRKPLTKLPVHHVTL